MLPLRDANPASRFPIVTVGLIAVNVLFFLYEVAFGLEQVVNQMGLIPFQLTTGFSGPVLIDVFTSMFLHGGLLHIGGNMLYLWIFGDNVEDVMGSGGFLVFYLLAGIAAALAQVLIGPGSRIPLVGASGAISGVLAAYLVKFPHARVLTLVTLGYWIRLTEVRAIWVLGFWFVYQFVLGFLSLGAQSGGGGGGGVAYFAHIGGFVAGLALVWVFAPGGRDPRVY